MLTIRPFVIAQLLAAFLLVPSTMLHAARITYYILDYALSQTDKSGMGVDTISGQITTDGTLGEYRDLSYHFVNAESFLRITTPQGTYSAGLKSVAGSLGHPQLYATETQLLIRDGDFFCPDAFDSSNPSASFVALWYIRNGTDVRYAGHSSNSSVGFLEYNSPSIDGHIGYHDPWVIAAVPELSTLVLVGVGVIFLVAYTWQRRGSNQSDGNLR